MSNGINLGCAAPSACCMCVPVCVPFLCLCMRAGLCHCRAHGGVLLCPHEGAGSRCTNAARHHRWARLHTGGTLPLLLPGQTAAAEGTRGVRGVLCGCSPFAPKPHTHTHTHNSHTCTHTHRAGACAFHFLRFLVNARACTHAVDTVASSTRTRVIVQIQTHSRTLDSASLITHTLRRVPLIPLAYTHSATSHKLSIVSERSEGGSECDRLPRCPHGREEREEGGGRTARRTQERTHSGCEPRHVHTRDGEECVCGVLAHHHAPVVKHRLQAHAYTLMQP